MALLDVLGGAIAFGFAGLVLGPVILAVISEVWVEATAHIGPVAQ
jgi:predicted PurR-regulated permease PerM